MVPTGCGQRPAGGHLPDPGVAQRIVTLSPHLTELAYTAGAGEKLVGVVDFSDYPAAARVLPRVGDAFRIDYERIAGLSPDLIIGWRSGNPPAVLDRLRDLGYRVETLDAAHLDDVAEALVAIGKWAGTADTAQRMAAKYRRNLAAIRRRFLGALPVTVFYQVSAQPFFTVSRRQVIGEAIELCGGRNIFGGLEEPSPAVSLEAILTAAPQAILIGSTPSLTGDPHYRPVLRRWDALPAVRMGNIFVLDADLLARADTRILQGVQRMCEALDTARARVYASGALPLHKTSMPPS